MIDDIYVSGIQLLGSEVKSVRMSDIQINDSFVEVRDRECFLINSHIKSSSSGDFFSHDLSRQRKLLLRKSEIKKIQKSVSQKGYTCVPLEVFWSGNLIKLKIGIAKGKRNYDKRISIKEREVSRMVREEIC